MVSPVSGINSAALNLSSINTSSINTSSIDTGSLRSAEGATAQRSRQSEPAAEAAGFGQSISDALSKLSATDSMMSQAAEAAATGDLQSINDYMIAATRAQITTEVTVAVRDRAISAFTDIMRMQV